MQIVRKLKTNMHICATGSKAERVVAHFLHIVVFVLISSQLFGVGWGGLITFICTSHTHLLRLVLSSCDVERIGRAKRRFNYS